MNSRKLYTQREAAFYLGVSEWTLNKWEAVGKIISVRKPGSSQKLYPQEQIDKALWKLDRRILV